jgi:hypothetical protein
MSQTASDNFVRPNANPMSGNWATVAAAGVTANQITGNVVESGNTTNGEHASYYTFGSFGANQWAAIQLSVLNGSSQAAPCVRMATNANTFYLLNIIAPLNASTIGTLQANVAASYTPLGTVNFPGGLAVGDWVAIQANGTTISAYKNGVFVVSFTDSSIASGLPGLRTNAVGTPSADQINAWAAGINNVAAVPPTFSPAAGIYSGAQTVTVTSKSGGTIYYTTDGTTPTHASPSIASGGTVTVGSTSVLSAIASVGGSVDDSAVATAGYTLNFNVWTPKGTLTGFAAIAGQPCVRYDPNPQILSANPDGKIFKMWYGAGAAVGINYAESSDGLSWTQYVSNPTIASLVANKIFFNAGTYYLYAGTSFTTGGINVYTSTTGLTWTLQLANAIVPTFSYEGTGCEQLSVAGQIGSTWYGYYDFPGNGTTTVWGVGQVTSTDLIHWTKTGVYWPGSQPGLDGNLDFHNIGSTYYVWSMTAAPLANANMLVRYSGPNPAGPWTLLSPQTYYPSIVSELNANANGLAENQLADPSLVEVPSLGNVYMYFTVGVGNSATFVINCAVAYGTTLAQLTQTSEGVLDVPFPTYNFWTGFSPSRPTQGPFGKNSLVSVSDNFTRANANPIGGNWTQLSNASGWSNAQILSNQVAPGPAGGNCDSWYNAANFSQDQWAAVVVAACTDLNQYVGVTLRQNTGNLPTAYRIFWNGGALGTLQQVYIQKANMGVFTFIQPFTVKITLLAGDTIMGAIIGPNIYVWWNGYPILTANDSSITTGAPGFMIGGAAGGAALSNFSVGSFSTGTIPAPPLSGGGGDLGPGYDFKFRL